MTEPLIRPFSDWLRDQRGGDAHAELSEALNELVESVAETGKGGQLTFVVKAKPAGKGDHGTVVVSDTTTLKKPQPERGEAIFFVTDNSNLTRYNPRQQELPLREGPRPDDVTEDGERVAK